MLARHAEDLFWMGRYLERAEDTARVLDVTHQTALEGGARPSPELWAETLEVLFLDDAFDAAVSPESVTRFLVSDRDNPGSIVSIIRRARDNARGAREWLSAEFWETLNDLDLQLRDPDLDRHLAQSPYRVLRSVKSGCQALSGVAESSVPRTEGYRFLLLGSMLERAMITARVTQVWQRRLGGFAGPAAFPEWVKLLKSLSAYEAYVRVYRAAMRPEQVLSFLLQDPEFPRSLLFCLGLAERQLGHIGGSEPHRALRQVGRLRAELEFAELAELEGVDVEAFLAHLEEALDALPHAVEREYFRYASDASIHAYEAF